MVSDVASWSLLTERIDLFFQLCLEDEDEEVRTIKRYMYFNVSTYQQSLD